MASIFMLGMNDKVQSLQHMVNKSNSDAQVLYFTVYYTSCILLLLDIAAVHSHTDRRKNIS